MTYQIRQRPSLTHEKFWDVLINLVDTVSILSRNGGIFLLISCTVRVYDTYTREISLLRRFGAAFRQAEKTMYSLQAHLANSEKETRSKTYATHQSVAQANTRLWKHTRARAAELPWIAVGEHCCSVCRGASGVYESASTTASSRTIHPHRRRCVFQIQTQGVGHVPYGTEAKTFTSYVLS